MRTSLALTVITSTLTLTMCSTPPPEDGDPQGGAGSKVDGKGGAGGSGTTLPNKGGNQASGGSNESGGEGGEPSGAGGSRDAGGSGGTQNQGGAPVAKGDVLGHPDPDAKYPEYPGFTLTLVEEFAAPIDLDEDPIWTWSDGGLPEGGVRFSKDAVSFRDGKMVLTVSKQTMPGSDSYAEPVSNADRGFVPTKPLRSGEMRTRFNNFRYGRYEVRMKPPTSDGNFIATLFAFRTPKFEDWREIDIELTADRPATVGTNVIYANNVGAWREDIQEFSFDVPQGDGAKPLPAGFGHQGEFHNYAFEWLPDRITWYVDDVPVRIKTAGGGLPIPEKSAKIIMNLWVFATAGGFGGDPTKNVYPMSSEYEWFRFYKWNDEAKYPCANPPTCLAAEDRNKSKNNPDDGLAP